MCKVDDGTGKDELIGEQMGYANREKKEAIALVATFIDLAEKWDNAKMMQGVRKELRTCRTLMWKVLNNLCKDIDEDQNHSLQLMCKNNELTFAPKMAKGLSEEFYTVPASDMRYIQEQIVERTGCDKEGKEIKGCKIRKSFLRAGIMPDGKNECPFSR